ncbi:hypothetical protein [Kordia jejudonensis]|uniref:hypothetical protein n=1 Tax=Kordia jejudonensis TaxID=1348245 RepID=UPI0006298346|nr:hypothetical protein [Kordia jejudonensis]
MNSKIEQKTDIELISELFIEAVDRIQEEAEQIGFKSKKSDNGIGKVIYPTSPGIVNSVRNKKNNIPHTALINFAKQFNVDMNYFYHDNISFKFNFDNFNSEIKNYTKSEMQENHNIFSTVNDLIEPNTLISFETNSLAEKFKLDTIIKSFANTLSGKFKQVFYHILHIIQFDYVQKIESLQENITKLTEINDIKSQLIKAKESENALLKKQVV